MRSNGLRYPGERGYPVDPQRASQPGMRPVLVRNTAFVRGRGANILEVACEKSREMRGCQQTLQQPGSSAGRTVTRLRMIPAMPVNIHWAYGGLELMKIRS